MDRIDTSHRRLSPFLKIAAVLALIPLMDIAAMAVMSRYVGWGATLGSVFACACIGAKLLRREAARVWREVKTEFRRTGLPASELLDGALLLVAGVLLVTPGPITDGAGLLLLLPPVRAGVRRLLLAYLDYRLPEFARLRRMMATTFGGEPATIRAEWVEPRRLM